MQGTVTEGNRVAGTDRLVPVKARLSGADLSVGSVAQLTYRARLATGTIVPTTALQTQGSRTVVYVASGGRAEEREVSVVAESLGRVAVRGLDAGQDVVNPVPPSLGSGAAIQVAGEKPASGGTP